MSRFFPNYPSYIITSPFGTRIHPVTGVKSTHNGIDLVATKDGKTGQVDYITAHTGGTVEYVGYSNSAGYYAKIRVSSDTVMVYYHMKEMPYVKKGATVKTGEKIGYMGSTGTATGAHLHWGIQKDGKWIDPKPYLDKAYTDNVTEEKKEEAKTEVKTEAKTEVKTESKKATDYAQDFSKSIAGTYEVTASMLNVRHGAGTNKKIMVAIPDGTKVKNYGYYTTVKGVKWLYIQFTYKGVTYTGFASSQYLYKR